MEKRVCYWSVGGEKFASLQKAKEFVREHAGAIGDIITYLNPNFLCLKSYIRVTI